MDGFFGGGLRGGVAVGIECGAGSVGFGDA